MWITRLGIGYVLADLLNMALVGAWIAVTIDMVVRMILVLRRFSSGVVFKEYSKGEFKRKYIAIPLFVIGRGKQPWSFW